MLADRRQIVVVEAGEDRDGNQFGFRTGFGHDVRRCPYHCGAAACVDIDIARLQVAQHGPQPAGDGVRDIVQFKVQE